jgi:hypothetical protein
MTIMDIPPNMQSHEEALNRAIAHRQNNEEALNRAIALRHLELDEKKAEQEYQIRLKEIELKEAENHRSRWSSPLVLSIIAASIAAVGNGYISLLNGDNQQRIEATRNASLKEIEQEKAEAARILEATKAASPEEAAKKIRFLIDVGLISDPNRQAALEAYIKPKPSQTSSTQETKPIFERYASGWLGGGNNQADQCRIGRSVITQKYPDKSVLLKSSSEESKKDLFGRVEYQYFCLFEIR